MRLGDAYLRTEAVDFRQAFAPCARKSYLDGLLRAWHAGSIEGVLSAGEAFAARGDRDVVRRAVVIARELLGPHPNATVLERLGALTSWTENHIVAARAR